MVQKTPLIFFVGWYLNPLRFLFSSPLGSGSLGLFVSSPLGPYKSQHCGHFGLLYIPRMMHEGDCGVIGGANDDCRGNWSTRRKPAPAPSCPPQIPHDQTRARTQAAAVGSQRLTDWASARPDAARYPIVSIFLSRTMSQVQIFSIQWTFVLILGWEAQ
jgi:hypothetical protein